MVLCILVAVLCLLEAPSNYYYYYYYHNDYSIPFLGSSVLFSPRMGERSIYRRKSRLSPFRSFFLFSWLLLSLITSQRQSFFSFSLDVFLLPPLFLQNFPPRHPLVVQSPAINAHRLHKSHTIYKWYLSLDLFTSVSKNQNYIYFTFCSLA